MMKKKNMTMKRKRKGRSMILKNLMLINRFSMTSWQRIKEPL
jgi:hypothetical protein